MLKLTLIALMIFSLSPSIALACPADYAGYLSNIKRYTRDETKGLNTIINEFNHCYLSQKAVYADPLLQLEYLRNIAYLTGLDAALKEAKSLFLSLTLTDETKQQHQQLLDIALLYRDTAFAQRIKANFTSDKEIPPQITHFHKRNLLKNTPQGRQWIGFEFPKQGHIIVVSNDFCAFSAAFHSFLQTHDQLKWLLKDTITWISPIDLELESGTRIYDIYSAAEWPEIDSWETPSIYFYVDGIVRSRMIGWQGDSSEEAFLAHLAEIGLLLVTEP